MKMSNLFKIKLYLLILFPLISLAQVFTIDNDYIELYSSSTEGEFSENTFLNTLEETIITYEIITDSLPEGWDFQNCFPTCNPLNTYSIDPISFPSDSTIYLNAHFYPNNVPGEGLLKMEISANHGTFVDTVTWRAVASPQINLCENLNDASQIKFITNLSGQKINNLQSEKIFIITYKNNRREVVYIIND